MSSLLDSINEAVLLTYFTGKHLYANASYDAVVRKLKMKDLLELGCRESEYRVRHKRRSMALPVRMDTGCPRCGGKFNRIPVDQP